MILKRLTAAAAALMMCCTLLGTGASAISDGEDPVTRTKITETVSKSGVKGFRKINNRVYSFTDGVGTPFTGKTKNSDGYHYYVNGSPWYGWMKIGSYWYYFRPDKQGVMATGSVNTVTGTYKFDSKGRWNGAVTKSSQANSGFGVRYCVSSSDSYLVLDTSSKTLINALSEKDAKDHTFTISVTARDRQVIYEMFRECELNSITSTLDYGGNGTVSLSVKLAGGTFSAETGTDCYKSYSSDKGVQKFAYYTAFLEQYIKSLPEYEQSEMLKSEMTMIEVISGQKVYKYKSTSYGIKESNINRDVIFTGKASVTKFVKNTLLKRKNVNYGYIKKLLGYNDAFFKDHVLLYSEALLPASAVTKQGDLTYDSENSLYTSNIKVKGSSGKASKQYVIITEGKRSANERGKLKGETVLTDI